MKIASLLFLLVVALGVLLATALLLPEQGGGAGVGHPAVPSMEQGGPGPERNGWLLAIGWVFGLLLIGLFVAVLAFGVRRDESLGPLAWAFLAGGTLYAGLFSAMMVAYRQFAADPTGATLVGGFPVPTAIMLYGVWPAPLFFMILYLVIFDRWIVTAEDADRFNELASARAGNSKPERSASD